MLTTMFWYKGDFTFWVEFVIIGLFWYLKASKLVEGKVYNRPTVADNTNISY